MVFVCRLDAWLSAAADCLELFPDQLIVVAGEQLSLQGGGGGGVSEEEQKEQTDQQKKVLFDTIVKYYGGQEKTPLLSGRHMDVHAAILKLLGQTLSHFTASLCFILRVFVPMKRLSRLCLRLLREREGAGRRQSLSAVFTSPGLERQRRTEETPDVYVHSCSD